MQYATPPLKELRFKRAVPSLEAIGVDGQGSMHLESPFPDQVDVMDLGKMVDSMVHFATVWTNFLFPRSLLQCPKTVNT